MPGSYLRLAVFFPCRVTARSKLGCCAVRAEVCCEGGGGAASDVYGGKRAVGCEAMEHGVQEAKEGDVCRANRAVDGGLRAVTCEMLQVIGRRQ